MGKTYCSWLLGKDYNNIIIIYPIRNLADSNLVKLYNYSEQNYNPILISMDRSRDINYIKSDTHLNNSKDNKVYFFIYYINNTYFIW